jgi:hypothetical protein
LKSKDDDDLALELALGVAIMKKKSTQLTAKVEFIKDKDDQIERRLGWG